MTPKIKKALHACEAANKNVKVGDEVWHLHHQQLHEMVNEPIQNRIDYIMKHKPEHERITRLEWLRPVLFLEVPREKAWAAYDKARAAYDKARAAYDKARAAYDKARAAYKKAWAAYDKARAAYDKARAAYNKAWAPYDKARAAYDKAWAAYDKARAAYDKARAAYKKAWADLNIDWEAQHRIELPSCPWNGRTLIFPVAQ
jgi:tetratricopeptide (TPR) repeat protein